MITRLNTIDGGYIDINADDTLSLCGRVAHEIEYILRHSFIEAVRNMSGKYPTAESQCEYVLKNLKNKGFQQNSKNITSVEIREDY